MKIVRIKQVLIVSLLIVSVLFLFAFKKEVDFSTSKSLDIFFSFFRDLNVFYVDKTDPEKLIRVGIDAMLQSLDPYNEFVPEESKEQFDFQTTGEYGGMGALIRYGVNYPVVSEVYEGTPSHKAGILVGDTIIYIDNISVKNLTVQKVSNLLKGAPKTELSVTVRRIGVADSLVFNFRREKIHLPSIPFYGIVNNNVGYIKLINFTAESSKDVEEKVEGLINGMGAKYLIFDLRGNPGGLLYEAVKIVNLFVEKNQLVVYTKGQIDEFDNKYETQTKPLDTTIPLAILVDRASASASEIVAGALQDLDRAIIIGERTFGKGLVQATRPLPYNTQVKITTAKYYIPSGRCIQAVDFTQRNEDGSISYIPDSLINEFTTKNGRIVYDGGGITPDILIEQSYYSRIASILYTNNYFFEYATIYHYGNRGKDVYPRNFKLSEREYDVFIDFLKTKNFKYQSQTEQILQDLTQAAKSENYLETIQPLIDSLQGVIELNRMNDFDLYKKEIKALLEEEIVSRYSFQRGRTEYEVSNDSIIQLSTDILRNKARYNEILTTGVN